MGGSYDCCDKVLQGVGGLSLKHDFTFFKQLDIKHIVLDNSKFGSILEEIWRYLKK